MASRYVYFGSLRINYSAIEELVYKIFIYEIFFQNLIKINLLSLNIYISQIYQANARNLSYLSNKVEERN